jgi:plastocyanin
MKKAAAFLLPLVLLSAIAVTACGKTPGGGGGNTSGGTVDHVNLTVDDFAEHSITVAVNTEFKFVDPSDTGGLHIICAGDNGKCIADPNAPQTLGDPGFQINAGETKSVTFAKAGTYKIACTVHPNMNLTIVVK